MDINAYINSGVLELYVLDRLDTDQRREVETYANQYPEVRQEINSIERVLEDYAVLRGEQNPPSPEVLDQVLSKIRTTGQPPAPPNQVRPVEETTKGGGLAWIAAVLAALALAAAIYFYQQLRERDEALTESEARFTTLQQDCETAQVERNAAERRLATLSNPDTKNVVLSGTENAPNSRAVVFYNEESGQVLFSAANLPTPPAGKQYQLWAIDANGPIDLGTLDRNLNQTQILEIQYVPDAANFAITLEDEGGKPTPDLSQLQVIGEVQTS